MVFGVPLPFLLRKGSDSLPTVSVKKDSIRESIRKHPFLSFTGGYAAYSLNYRSALDTPYLDKNITQHQVQSTLYFTMGGMIPLRVNSLMRRGNSSIFRDITDVQVAFDAAAYRSGLAARIRERMMRNAPSPDSLAAKLYKIRLHQVDDLQKWLNDPLTRQKLIEANEVIHVPRLNYDMQLPDSINRQREDSIKKEAALLLSMYKETQERWMGLTGSRDSLKAVYEASVGKLNQYKKMLSAPGLPAMPDALTGNEKWLMGVRNFGLGRNNVNTSELTAKNLSLNGIHFEYNSWYFLGVTAGLVDYRFRDFVIHRPKQPRQYMYMLRAGLGRLERNYFIVSVFGGQKQFLNSVNSAGQSPTIRTTGLSVESKWQIERHSFLLAEAAQSFSPALPGSDPGPKGGWSLSDKSNKALSLKLSSWIPATGSRLEAQYKFTGANYQSFNSWQTNAQQRSWYVKAEQDMWKRQLKITASLRSNDFSNPYIVQRYSANTIFKSLGLSFRRKGLPIVTIGWMPMSQLTKVGDTLEESKFQTINASLSHFYRLGTRQASTNIVYTRFFNISADSGFIYYNSTNIYAGQSIFFRDFTATTAFSHSRSAGYQYNVLEGNVSVPMARWLTIGLGSKLHELNGSETGVGGFFDAQAALGSRDKLSMHLEKSYLPGSGTKSRLVPNVLGSLTLIKVFK